MDLLDCQRRPDRLRRHNPHGQNLLIVNVSPDLRY